MWVGAVAIPHCELYTKGMSGNAVLFFSTSLTTDWSQLEFLSRKIRLKRAVANIVSFTPKKPGFQRWVVLSIFYYFRLRKRDSLIEVLEYIFPVAVGYVYPAYYPTVIDSIPLNIHRNMHTTAHRSIGFHSLQFICESNCERLFLHQWARL